MKKSISVEEILKIINFVDADHYGDLYPEDAMSDGEVLDHVIDKLKALVQPEPYIDQWTKEQFINQTFNKKEVN